MSLSTPNKMNTSAGSHDGSFSSKLELSGYNTSPASRPAGRDNKAGWYGMHEKHEAMAKRGTLEYILCGDSIIAGLSRYIGVWRKYFSPLNALNLGIGGDRTQHVLWRAENLEISPSVKYVVLHCGTNNIDRDTASCIANGILSVAVTFQEKVIGLKVLVTGLLPRDPEKDSYRREKIEKVNKIVKRMCRTKFDDIFFMKQDDDWIQDNGRLDESLYFTDHLHLIEKGNEKFANSITKSLEIIQEEGALEYSSDEDESETDEEYQYERLVSQKRKREHEASTNDRDDDGWRHSSSRKRRRRSDSHRSRRRQRSSSLSPSSSHRRKHRHSHHDARDRLSSRRSRRESKHSHGTDNKTVASSDDNDEDCKWNSAREVATNRNKKRSAKEKPSEKEEGEDIKNSMAGTVKSIDITMDIEKRREARRNKFSAPVVTGPIALVQRIQATQLKEQARRKDLEELSRKSKLETLEREKKDASPDNLDDDVETNVSVTTKKFFSDFTADSGSE